MEAISHNAVGRKEGRGTAAVGKRTKLFVRPFSAPLFKFTLCGALPRSLQESDEKQPESREETKRERTENQCNNAGSLLMMFSNQCSQPSSLLFFFFQCERKVCHCTQRIITILPLSKPWVCVCCAESICGTKDTDTPNGGHSLRHSGCISIGKVHHPRAGLAR